MSTELENKICEIYQDVSLGSIVVSPLQPSCYNVATKDIHISAYEPDYDYVLLHEYRHHEQFNKKFFGKLLHGICSLSRVFVHLMYNAYTICLIAVVICGWWTWAYLMTFVFIEWLTELDANVFALRYKQNQYEFTRSQSSYTKSLVRAIMLGVYKLIIMGILFLLQYLIQKITPFL